MFFEVAVGYRQSERDKIRGIRLQEGWKDGRMESVAIQRLHLLK